MQKMAQRMRPEAKNDKASIPEASCQQGILRNSCNRMDFSLLTMQLLSSNWNLEDFLGFTLNLPGYILTMLRFFNYFYDISADFQIFSL